jgi:hypothetical protein
MVRAAGEWLCGGEGVGGGWEEEGQRVPGAGHTSFCVRGRVCDSRAWGWDGVGRRPISACRCARARPSRRATPTHSAASRRGDAANISPRRAAAGRESAPARAAAEPAEARSSRASADEPPTPCAVASQTPRERGRSRRRPLAAAVAPTGCACRPARRLPPRSGVSTVDTPAASPRTRQALYDSSGTPQSIASRPAPMRSRLVAGVPRTLPTAPSFRALPIVSYAVLVAWRHASEMPCPCPPFVHRATSTGANLSSASRAPPAGSGRGPLRAQPNCAFDR